MSKKFDEFLDKLLLSNFKWSLVKHVYLYNELFISVFFKNDFFLIWLSLKVGKLKVNNYKWVNNNLLNILIKKYENVFIWFLKSEKNNLFKVWNESEFINIYDNKRLSYDEIKNKLNFSFLDDYTYRRRSELDFNFEDKSNLEIYHSDFECSKCDWPVESFTNFPNFRDWVIDTNYFPENKTKKHKLLVTNISDYESIAMWWNEKINDIMENKELIDEYELLSINKTCISIIMWDELESIFKYNKVDKSKLFYTDQNTDSWYRVVLDFLKWININNTIDKNNEIVFFGLSKNKNTFELIKDLEDNFWIKVWNVLLPNINKKDLENIMSYDYWVFFKWKEIKAQSIFKLYPINNFESNVPYSISENYNLYKNILDKKSILNEEKLGLYFKNIKDSKSELFDKLLWKSIWFIIFDFHFDKFVDWSLRWIDILGVLKDMWFVINIFVVKTDSRYNISINDNDINITNSNDEKKLEEFISNPEIPLYYSEVSNDKRILSKWKQQISIWDFEYWIDWFFRTMELFITKINKINYIKNNLEYYLNNDND